MTKRPSRSRAYLAMAFVLACPLGAPVFAQDDGKQDDGQADTGDEKASEPPPAAPLPAFARRAKARDRARKGFPGRKAQTAVDLALEWLKNHQAPDGRWETSGFSKQCKLNKCDGSGGAAYDPGITGGALLCFLGVGQTHQVGAYKEVVSGGLGYLRKVQDSEGCFGPRTAKSFQYNHALAALAMVEAYGGTGSSVMKEPAQRGINFVQLSQNPYLAWRYGVRDGDNDTSVTAWMVQVLRAGQLAELDVNADAFKGAIAWVDKMTEPEFGRVGYQQRGGPPSREATTRMRFPSELSESLTGAGVLVRVFTGADPKKDEYVQKGVALMLAKPPVWEVERGRADFYYWYYGTMAMFQVGGTSWKSWDKSLKKAVPAGQRTETGRDERGSWDPVDPWSEWGGRIYATFMNTLCLEAEYRYPRLSRR